MGQLGKVKKNVGPRALVVLTFKEEISRIILGLTFFFWVMLDGIKTHRRVKKIRMLMVDTHPVCLFGWPWCAKCTLELGSGYLI